MGTDQYHEPANELSSETRTFARMITGLVEEAEAIGWYEQRLSVEKDKQAHAIMQNAQKEEFKHFGMDLEFLFAKKQSGAKYSKQYYLLKAISSKPLKRQRKPPTERDRSASNSGRPHFRF